MLRVASSQDRVSRATRTARGRFQRRRHSVIEIWSGMRLLEHGVEP